MSPEERLSIALAALARIKDGSWNAWSGYFPNDTYGHTAEEIHRQLKSVHRIAADTLAKLI